MSPLCCVLFQADACRRRLQQEAQHATQGLRREAAAATASAAASSVAAAAATQEARAASPTKQMEAGWRAAVAALRAEAGAARAAAADAAEVRAHTKTPRISYSILTENGRRSTGN